MRAPTGTRTTATRRDALRILAVGGLAGAAWALGVPSALRARPVVRARVMMGTELELRVLSGDRERAEEAADATLARMASLERLLSRHRSDSEVSRLNATGRIEGASAALLDVLTLAQRVSRLGDGHFDVTVAPLLDLYRRRIRAGRGLPAPEALEAALEHICTAPRSSWSPRRTGSAASRARWPIFATPTSG